MSRVIISWDISCHFNLVTYFSISLVLLYLCRPYMPFVFNFYVETIAFFCCLRVRFLSLSLSLPPFPLKFTWCLSLMYYMYLPLNRPEIGDQIPRLMLPSICFDRTQVIEFVVVFHLLLWRHLSDVSCCWAVLSFTFPLPFVCKVLPVSFCLIALYFEFYSFFMQLMMLFSSCPLVLN